MSKLEKQTKFLKGAIIIMKKVDIHEGMDVFEAFENIEEDVVLCDLDRVIILPNNQENRKLKFDLTTSVTPVLKGGYFNGFLYNDSKVWGKIKFPKEPQTSDSVFQGYYITLENGSYLICGQVTENKINIKIGIMFGDPKLFEGDNDPS